MTPKDFIFCIVVGSALFALFKFASAWFKGKLDGFWIREWFWRGICFGFGFSCSALIVGLAFKVIQG
ncbi:hypothetical protein SAMN05421749_103300 [Acinetobacter marinus]|uniref:Uncharacterized protein n=1 Tax=Acinetobacter marinus TaxID=281375 RepID=A0A1G6JDL3_9GAMM|nr:hypothetical protein SAMN05421749_103300 [Acinetobacter marinus]